MSTDDTTTTLRPEAAGRREDRDGLPYVVIERMLGSFHGRKKKSKVKGKK